MDIILLTKGATPPGNIQPPAATPTFSPAAGTYTSTQNVVISCSTTSSSIFYTTNGTTPTTASTAYTGAVTVSASGTLKAIATAPSHSQSAVGSAAYTINTSALSVAVGSGANAGKLVNGSGQVLQLRGADTDGMEGSYALGGSSSWDYGGWTSDNTGPGVQPPFAALASAYKWNFFRIPLNVGSILGQTCYLLSGLAEQSDGSYNLPSSLSGLATRSMDPHGTYLADIDAAVAACNAAGCYVILDIHLWFPDVVIGGTTVHCVGGEQANSLQMPDENAIAALQVLGNRYKNNPAVIFDLANEPTYPTWVVWKNGGAQTQATYYDGINSYGLINTPWTSVGMDALLTAVRSTGATNVCMIGGIEYCQELGNNGFYDTSSTWLESIPTDTLSPPQICASIHLYPNGSSSYGSTNYYQYFGADQNPPPYKQWIPWVQAIVAAGHPVVIGEAGGQSQGSGEPFMTTIVNEVDTLNAAYSGTVHITAWGASPYTPPGADNQLLYYTNSTTYVVTTANGAVYTTWTKNHT